MALLVSGIVLILLFVAGLFGSPPSMTAYVLGGVVLFLGPGILCVVLGVRRIRHRHAEPQPAPTQADGPAARPVPVVRRITPPTSGALPPAWQPDPLGRHQQRYWDGARWTRHVADDGLASVEPESTDELVRVIRDGSDVDDQVRAARVLGTSFASVAVPSLVEVAVSRTRDPRLRDAALDALAQIGDTDAAEPLVAAAVAGDFRASLFAALGRALESVGTAAALGPLLLKVMSSNREYDDHRDWFDDQNAEFLTQTDRERQESVSDDCAEILGRAGAKGADALLAALAMGTPRWAVARALGAMPDPPVDRLVILTRAESPLVRRAALTALGDAASRGNLLRDSIVGALRAACADDDEGVRRLARDMVARVDAAGAEEEPPAPVAPPAPREDEPAETSPPAPPPVTEHREEPAPASLVSDDHEDRGRALAALLASGCADPPEPRTLGDLTDAGATDPAALRREVREHPDFDVAYVRAAYPTGRSEDHAHADPDLLRQGVAHCRRRGYLLARLSSYATWQDDPSAALDHAVAAVLLADPAQGPGDMVQVTELLASAFRRTGHLADAAAVAAVQAPYALGPSEAAAVDRVATQLAEHHAGDVDRAADLVRQRLTAATAAVHRSPR